MSTPEEPKPAKLVVGMFMQNRALYPDIVRTLTESYGPVDTVSRWLPFTQTDYYTEEMGSPLFRRLMGFVALVQQDGLADVKGFTNRLESKYTEKGKRRVNIDPGYLVAERFVLATGKNYTHRIYLQEGIYADLTLVYQRGAFCPLDWTYPDYAGRPIINFLTAVRERYLCQMRESRVRVLED